MAVPSIDLSHLRVLVTGGGGTGVGGGVCQVLSACGAQVIVNDIDPVRAEEAAHRYPGAVAIAGDISQAKDIERLFETVNQAHGSVNGLVNNAGVGLSKLAHEVSEAEFDRLYSIDIRGVWLASRAFVRQLLPTGQRGGIVNISSVHAYGTQARYAIYCSAKSAVEGLTKGMAIELGRHGIRCNAIGPGYVHAEQNYDLIRTWAEDPEQWVQDFIQNQQAIPSVIDAVDCGHTAAFLLSDLSQAITGQCIYVDKGTTIMLLNKDFTEPS